jgi:hypothetical protein
MDPKPAESSASASAPAESAPAATPAGAAEERKLGPMIAVGGGILALAALIAFWPSDGDKPGKKGKKGNLVEAGVAEAGGAAGRGGVQAREFDEAKAARTSRRNPAVRLPDGMGVSPQGAPQPEAPPSFASKEEEIAWYEKRLEKAMKARDDRKKFAERLPGVKERIEQSPNFSPEQLEAFKKRETVVKDNLTKAEAEVEKIEKKLAELRGG